MTVLVCSCVTCLYLLAQTDPTRFIMLNTRSNKYYRCLWSSFLLLSFFYKLLFSCQRCLCIILYYIILRLVLCCDQSNQGNASALNALDPSACFSPAVKHIHTQANLRSLSSPPHWLSFSTVIGCLLSICPSSQHTGSQSEVHSNICHWLACAVNADTFL